MSKSTPRNIKAQTLTNLVVKNGGNLAVTARQLGITRQAVQERVKKNPVIQSAIETAMDKAGLTQARILNKVNKLMDCKKTISLGSGENSSIEEVDDNSAQVKATEMAAKMRGLIKNGGDVVVDASQKTLQVFNKLNDEEFDIASAQGMIADLNSGLSSQRKQ